MQFVDKISAVIVTKGGYDITPVLQSLPFEDVVVWDNSKEATDRKVYGRYLGADRAWNKMIYVQDDDAIVDIAKLMEHFPAQHPLLCNMPMDRRYSYRDGICLMGWGSIFPRSVIEPTFDKYLAKYPADELFDRECDRIFSYLVPHVEVDVPLEHLPRAFGTERMGLESRHGADLVEIRRRLKELS